jgi:hypothetical protein
VITTEGQILVFPDYNSWDAIIPHGTYVADATERDGKFYIIDAHLFTYSAYQRPWVVGEDRDYPTYYQDDYGNYWQYDGHRADPVSYKQVRRERIIRGNPPGYGAGNPDRSIAYGSGNPYH